MFDYLYSLGLVGVTIVAVISLFTLRKSAVTWFWNCPRIECWYDRNPCTTSWREALAGPGIAGVILGYALLFAILLYTRVV